MGKTVEFKYDINEKVITSFGDEGIIYMLAWNGDENEYYVKTRGEDSWFKEEHLRENPAELLGKTNHHINLKDQKE